MRIELVDAGSATVTCLMVDIFGGLISCSVSGCACITLADACGADQVTQLACLYVGTVQPDKR